MRGLGIGVMRVRATLLGAALIASFVTAFAPTGASATMRISDDVGGRIGAYVDQYSEVRNSGERVVIDGACLSACTLVLGIVPPDRVCVTDGAMLGFHAAWRPNAFGGKSPAADQTQRMLESYPASVRQWLSRQGGLSSHMVFAHGRTLNAMVRRCPPQAQARLDY